MDLWSIGEPWAPKVLPLMRGVAPRPRLFSFLLAPLFPLENRSLFGRCVWPFLTPKWSPNQPKIIQKWSQNPSFFQTLFFHIFSNIFHTFIVFSIFLISWKYAFGLVIYSVCCMSRLWCDVLSLRLFNQVFPLFFNGFWYLFSPKMLKSWIQEPSH